MHPHYLLDTNAVSDALRGSAPSILARVARMPKQRVAMSIITAMELRFGLAKNPQTRLRSLVERFLDTFPTLTLPEEAIAVYGHTRASLERRGTPIGALDTIIAAHALAIDATLVTRNAREFQRVPGLRVEAW